MDFIVCGVSLRLNTFEFQRDRLQVVGAHDVIIRKTIQLAQLHIHSRKAPQGTLQNGTLPPKDCWNDLSIPPFLASSRYRGIYTMGPPVINKPILLHSMRMNMCDLSKLTQVQQI
jgi:hypothetical protein